MYKRDFEARPRPSVTLPSERHHTGPGSDEETAVVNVTKVYIPFTRPIREGVGRFHKHCSRKELLAGWLMGMMR